MIRVYLVLVLSILLQYTAEGQIISYGEQQDLSDSIVIAKAAPEWIKSNGYPTLESYIEDKLFFNPILNFQRTLNGINAYLYFTVEKDGNIIDVDVSCAETQLILPLINILDSMPKWKPGIRNDKNIKTKMEFYVNIQQTFTNQFVVKQERLPPKPIRSNLALKISIITVCVALLLWKIL